MGLHLLTSARQWVPAISTWVENSSLWFIPKREKGASSGSWKTTLLQKKVITPTYLSASDQASQIRCKKLMKGNFLLILQVLKGLCSYAGSKKQWSVDSKGK